MTGHLDHSVKIWDAAGGRLLQVLDGHTKQVNSVAVSSDGRSILTGGVDGTIRVWPVGEDTPTARR